MSKPSKLQDVLTFQRN